MRNILIVSTCLLSLAGYGYAFAAAVTPGPVFPAESTKAESVDVVPTGAQFRIASGKGFKYVACNGTRLVLGKHEERHCLTFSKGKNAWGKSMKWIPSYQLLPLA